MTTTAVASAGDPRLHTIGAVCERLQGRVPDISISKIRYLEDQGLLAPRRTQGGYRLFSEDDVERLETILRLQRDEFLPLRVIRQELASPAGRARAPARRPALGEEEPSSTSTELCERAGIDARARARARGVRPARAARSRRESALPRSATPTSRSPAADSRATASRRAISAPSAPRRTARPALLEQVVAPALRSRNPERRAARRSRTSRRSARVAHGAGAAAPRRATSPGGVSMIE